MKSKYRFSNEKLASELSEMGHKTNLTLDFEDLGIIKRIQNI